MDLALRITAILFPMFALTGLGYWYARRHATDMSAANRINMDVFVPALIFSGLSARSYDLASYGGLALGMVILVLGSGAAAWVLAKLFKQQPLTLAPPMMFNNSVNLGVPLAVLAFGNDALPWAIVLFVVSTGLHFSLGIWLLDHKTKLSNVWRVPAVLAALAGFAVGESHIVLWSPLAMGIKMLADISIPLALFALGVRMTDAGFSHWREGLLGAIARPIAGMAIAWAIAPLLGLHGQQADLLLVYGSLPPAVINYVFAERYHQEPAKVAAIVLVGNLAAIVTLPLVLAIVL
ncbi:MAG: AEC family transporter [Rhodocyclaceae bacterium]|nr:MAG: AEC family transporter [Rhodocyclaceae bacterium]